VYVMSQCVSDHRLYQDGTKDNPIHAEERNTIRSSPSHIMNQCVCVNLIVEFVTTYMYVEFVTTYMYT